MSSRGGVTTFGLVAGLLVGALAAVVVLPDRDQKIVTARQGEVTGAGAGSESPATEGASGEAYVPGPGQSAAGSGEPATSGGGTDAAVASGARSAGGGASGAVNVTTTAPVITAPTAPVRGVTDKTIKIGIATLNLAELRALGPGFDNGDRAEHFKSILEGWRRDKQLPVHGRDIQFVFREYSVLQPAQQREACVGLIQDAKVFAVIGDSQFRNGIDCIAREFRTPLVVSDPPPDDNVFLRGHPNLFSVQMATGRMWRNWIHWANSRGILKGKKIGLYRDTDPVMVEMVNRTIKRELARFGHTLAAESTTEPNSLGGPNDTLAVQQFRAANVDLALLLASRMGFVQQAEAQAYKPTYIDSDWLSGTTSTATSTYPANQWDGTFAMSGMRWGEWNGGLPTPPAAQKCAADYERHSGKRIDPKSREAEWGAMNKGCDAATVLLKGLQGAGRTLTPQTLIAAIERIRNLPMAMHGNTSFAPTRHHGADQQRTLRWERGCACWKPTTPFGALWVL